LIITRTPVRVSFLGGGTDYPEHFRRHGGQTLGAAIDKYSYITVNAIAPLFDYSIRVGYSRTELVREVAEIEHPAVRECLRFLDLGGGLEINYVGDLPARTGLGSSSSFTVGLLHALHALKGQFVGRSQLAEEAVHVEREMIRERVGVQDQYTCAYGGLVHLRFSSEGAISVSPVPLPRGRLADLQAHLMLVYTGLTRHSQAILEEQLQRTSDGSVTGELNGLAALVEQGLEVLTTDRPIACFGELLHAAWMTKRKLSSRITTSGIDERYALARRAGAIGGKLLGAGGGGFLLLLVPPERQDQVERELTLPRVRFAFDHGGSSLLFYQPS
jgi:D-glycero-alpha-D-manno-heptose-7-phosphate kinase